MPNNTQSLAYRNIHALENITKCTEVNIETMSGCLKMTAKRWLLLLAAYIAYVVILVSIHINDKDMSPLVALSSLGTLFVVPFCLIMGGLASQKARQKKILADGKINVDMKIADSIIVDRGRRIICLQPILGESKIIAWSAIKEYFLEYEQINNETTWFIRFSIADFNKPTIKHRIGSGRGFGPQEEARKAFAQIDMLLKGEA